MSSIDKIIIEQLEEQKAQLIKTMVLFPEKIYPNLFNSCKEEWKNCESVIELIKNQPA